MLSLDSSVIAKVGAINIIGLSDYSDDGNGAVISMSYAPDAPTNLARNHGTTTRTQLGLTWTDGASNGGQPILDYRVSFDQGNGNWVVLQDGVTSQSLEATGATPGTTYEFKIESRNIIGYSTESESISIKAAIIPSAPTNVVTSRSINDIIISWQSPSSDPATDFGDSVMGFKIFIRTNDMLTFDQD
jgi:hypothetical protein